MTDPLSTFAPPLSGPPRLAPSDVSYVLDDTAVGPDAARRHLRGRRS